jgi:hypothetical protein
MTITQSLQGEHGAINALLNFIEHRAPDASTEQLGLLAGVLSAILLSHADIEDELLVPKIRPFLPPPPGGPGAPTDHQVIAGLLPRRRRRSSPLPTASYRLRRSAPSPMSGRSAARSALNRASPVARSCRASDASDATRSDPGAGTDRFAVRAWNSFRADLTLIVAADSGCRPGKPFSSTWPETVL